MKKIITAIVLSIALPALAQAKAPANLCPQSFVKAYLSYTWDSGAGRKTPPTTKQACVMSLPNGRGDYLCEDDGCRRCATQRCVGKPFDDE